jgi:hypothetical protein
MVVTSASSTPLMAFLGAILAYCFWPLRRQMRWVRRGLVAVLVGLHLVMKAPVWNLIARVDVVGGNSADHRYQLVNQTILHFRDWWLYGTVHNEDWGWDMWDTANAFVGAATSSGLLGFILFVALFSRSFRAIGKARAACDGDKKREFEFWAIGSLLFTQLMVFVGVSYFDQTNLAWYVLLCIVMALCVCPENLAMPTEVDFRLPRKVGLCVPAAVPVTEPADPGRGLTSNKFR